jgi:gas vesicle protein
MIANFPYSANLLNMHLILLFMVFKKGHKPANKKKDSAIKKPASNVSDFYVKFGVKSDMKNNLSNLSYLIATLKNDLWHINNLRGKKAYLRKNLYEILISLRLGVDSLERHLPSKEFEALKNKIEEISRFAKKEAAKKPEIAKVSEPVVAKKVQQPIKKIVDEIKDDFAGASDKERKELEKLKADLEEISKQLKEKD